MTRTILTALSALLVGLFVGLLYGGHLQPRVSADGGRPCSTATTARPTSIPGPGGTTRHPLSQVHLVTAVAFGPGQTARGITTAFTASTPRIFAVATFSRLLPGDHVFFRFIDTGRGVVVWQ